MQLSRIVSALAGACVIAGSVPLCAAPASANVPPTDTSACIFSFSSRQATSSTVSFTVTGSCNETIDGIGHYMTVQRSGKVIGTPRHECTNTKETTHFSCSGTVKESDPAGTQTFEVLDEWEIYGGVYGSQVASGKNIWSFRS